MKRTYRVPQLGSYSWLLPVHGNESTFPVAMCCLLKVPHQKHPSCQISLGSTRMRPNHSGHKSKRNIFRIYHEI